MVLKGGVHMNGIAFGKELKRLRNKVGISSKILSTSVGKAVTYVSQLENGKIKNPDFETCLKLLQELGVEKKKIEGVLDYFGIISPEREQEELEMSIRLFEQKEDRWKLGWYENKIEKLLTKNEVLHRRMESFIHFDVTRADTVISNMVALSEDEEKFEFLCSLFENNFASLNLKDMEQVLRLVSDFVKEKNTESFTELFGDEEKENK
jgi:transcriptional regulator with XRE-family HTH domain